MRAASLAVHLIRVAEAVVDSTGPSSLAGVNAFAACSAHSLALRGEGSLLIWGDGLRGNLGKWMASSVVSFVPLVVKSELDTATLSLGPIRYRISPVLG